MFTEEDGRQVLSSALQDHHARFHEGQWDAINAIVNQRRRTLVVQRTGWGKSAVYFIASRLIHDASPDHRVTLIISPLLALMRDQIEAGARFGVKVASINSAQDRAENDDVVGMIEDDEVDALIISPEQLGKESMINGPLARVATRLGLLVVDEAHCISDWGHDFRPDYTRIVGFLNRLPSNVPVLATTATANRRVQQDIANQIGGDPMVLRGPLTRRSLRLQNIRMESRAERLAWLAQALREEREQHQSAGIVYVSTIRDATLVTAWLQEKGFRAFDYTGTIRGMTAEESREARLKRERLLAANEVDALVATSALGMGYDKPDLRFVIHFQSPGSAIAYYQQVGRAGRAIAEALGILMSGSEDDDIQRYFIRAAFPSAPVVADILETCQKYDDLTTTGILRFVNASKTKVEAALRFLKAQSPAPLIQEGRTWIATPLAENYTLPEAEIAEVTQWKEREWSQMKAYHAHEGCLMRFLADELEDESAADCGRCANCDPDSALLESIDPELLADAEDFIERRAILIPPRRQMPAETRFEHHELRGRLNELACEPGMALCRYGESRLAVEARRCKDVGEPSDRIIDAMEELFQKWRPGIESGEPPRQITFIPSSTGNKVVPRLAQRLSERLGLPLVDLVEFTGLKSAQQKSMQNSHKQCWNLDGRFKIRDGVPAGVPLLLVDDACDSRWTFTIVGALLRQAGSGPVYPLAMMDTSSS